MPRHPRVLIVAEHASLRFGGEAALPLHYFVGLRRRGVDVWMIVHARTRPELRARLEADIDRVLFVEDDLFHRIMWRIGQFLPSKVSYHSTGFLSRLRTQMVARRLAKALVRSNGIEVVHQPIPVSPKEPSVLAGLAVPVIIGPMNGNMTYPPGLSKGSVKMGGTRLLRTTRSFADKLHHILPGKKFAARLLVANDRTRVALPKVARGSVHHLVENGVDTDLWAPIQGKKTAETGILEIAFMGRLIALKRVDLAIRAIARLTHPSCVRLKVIGDGPERPNLEKRAEQCGIAHLVEFTGWREQTDASVLLSQADCLILPSIHECGGAVVLEAMSLGLPVIATAWGGPLDYITKETGFLIEPTSEEALIQGFVHAIESLARNPSLATSMGKAGRRRIEEHFTWSAKVDTILQHYREVSGLPE